MKHMVCDSLPPAIRNGVIFPQAAVMLHRIDGKAIGSLQPAQNGIQGGFGKGHNRLNILDQLIAIGIPPGEQRQNAYLDHATLHLHIHGITSF